MIFTNECINRILYGNWLDEGNLSWWSTLRTAIAKGDVPSFYDESNQPSKSDTNITESMHRMEETPCKEKFSAKEQVSIHQHTLVLPMVLDSHSPLIPIWNRTSRVQQIENSIPPLVFTEGGEVNSLQVLGAHIGRETTMVVSQITSHPNLPVEIVGEVHSYHHAIGQQAARQSTTNHL